MPEVSEAPRRRWPLLIVVCALIAAAFAPFTPGFEGPYWARNQARFEEGTLHLSEPSIVRTRGAPAWLTPAIEHDGFELDLEVRSADGQQSGPARILTLSRDWYARNLMVAQEGENLLVRLRRPGSDLDGSPPLVARSVFGDDSVARGAWHRVKLQVGPAGIAFTVDGERYATEAPPSRPLLEDWDPGYPLSLGDELTRSRAFAGALRRATISIGERSFNLLDDGTLEQPSGFWEIPERARNMLELDRGPTSLFWIWHCAVFVPFGLALACARRRPPTWILAVSIAVPLSLLLELGKLLFEGRHPSLLHVVPDAIGTLIGVSIARRYFARISS